MLTFAMTVFRSRYLILLHRLGVVCGTDRLSYPWSRSRRRPKDRGDGGVLSRCLPGRRARRLPRAIRLLTRFLQECMNTRLDASADRRTWVLPGAQAFRPLPVGSLTPESGYLWTVVRCSYVTSSTAVVSICSSCCSRVTRRRIPRSVSVASTVVTICGVASGSRTVTRSSSVTMP